MAVYARIRAYVLAESDLVTNHVRIVGTRNERGFRNLLPGDPWQFGDGGVRYASVESDLRARIDVARSLLTKLYKVIDAVSIRAAPEMAEENLPPLRIVFSSCRSRGGAFSGTGVRRQDLPAGTGVYKPAAYWNALHSSREEYYDIDKCQSIGNREGKNLSARAGDAVKRIGCPILIAIPIGGQLRYYHLFSDFVDYLCYYDLRIWQEEAGAPNELAYPAPIQATKIQHGYFTQMGIHRTYHIVGDLCRLSIATHGTDSASISRNQKAISVMAVYARIRAYVLAESDLVTNHVRIVGTRNERGFRNLLPGDPWQFGDGGVRYASVESDLRARIDVARSLLTKLYKVIDAVSIRAAPEMAEENLPPLRIVFSSCRSRGGAFSGTGVRRQDLPAGTGVYKPAAYWNALHSSREEYYDIDKCQSIGNREGKNLSARAGDAVKRIGCPILIAIPIGGQLRYYHLFSDFVDYLCYYDLRIWQEEAGAPNELAYPAPIQA